MFIFACHQSQPEKIKTQLRRRKTPRKRDGILEFMARRDRVIAFNG
jgi:hypothetical protein